MDSQQKNKYIPLYASETAVLHDTNTILPRDEIYKPLAELIRHARDRAIEATSSSKSLDAIREHNAISIDGSRGTGKTAVLVNLKRYLELEHKDLLADVHILKPIDPTLLEDGESLFLHIIVAAVLHDDNIKQAQHKNPDKARKLNKALDQLAHSLEAVDTQKERHGMDKVRAMYGNKQLADSVHEFFLAAAKLLEKRMLILPIDDVDTSLNLAFENLEIIRRYLTTPYVLPIVSGDRKLYDELTWRDFHGRLIKDSTYYRQSAYLTAVDLAKEYQRKVLPFPRRQMMPEVSTYWQWSYDRNNSDGKGVMLGSTDNGMPLANFISWLEIYLTGPVNGQENSRLPLPIPSIRALTQLVNHCSDFIPALPDAIRKANSELEVRRVWQMPTVPLSVITEFQNKHQELGKQKKREYSDAYKVFADKLLSESAVDYSCDTLSAKKLTKQALSEKLAKYFCFEPKAGAIYLVLLAKQHWQHWTESSKESHQGSIFDTPLFQPLTHDEGEFSEFKKSDDLSAWSDALVTRLPSSWLTGIKSRHTILPYPLAEVGFTASKSWDYQQIISLTELDGLNDENRKDKAIFLISLLVQHNFYSNAKQTMLLNIGRVFELIISSIIAPVSPSTIQAIMVEASFFSTRALAPTKTIFYKSDYEKTAIENIPTELSESEFDPIIELHEQIEKWRQENKLEQIDLSPWLVYKVFNKVYSQVASSELAFNGTPISALNIVAFTFYATWSAFGSFEKGELFGLPNVVSTNNINPEKIKNFEKNDHFSTNVGPFAPSPQQIANKQSESYRIRSLFGKETRTISYCLADHPLKNWIDELIALDWPKVIISSKETKSQNNKTEDSKNKYPEKTWLCEKLNISIPDSLRVQTIKKALDDWSLDKCNKLLEEIRIKFPNKLNSTTIKNLEKAIKQKTEAL